MHFSGKTYSSDVGVLDPRLDNERAYTMYDYNGIVVLRCYRLDETVATMPRC